MHAWEEAVDCSQLPLSVILEKWSPLTRSCYQKAILQGLLRNICSCLGSTSSSSSTWSATSAIFARLSHHGARSKTTLTAIEGATSTYPKSLLAMLSRKPQGIPLWCDYLSLWTPRRVYKAKVGLRLQSKPRKFMCQYCLWLFNHSSWLWRAFQSILEQINTYIWFDGLFHGRKCELRHLTLTKTPTWWHLSAWYLASWVPPWQKQGSMGLQLLDFPPRKETLEGSVPNILWEEVWP